MSLSHKKSLFILKIAIISCMHFLQGHVKYLVEHVIIYGHHKMSQIAGKFGSVYEVGNFILHAKNNHCIIYRFYKDISKVWRYYYFLNFKYIATPWNLNIFVRYTDLLYAVNNDIISRIDFYNVQPKIWYALCFTVFRKHPE